MNYKFSPKRLLSGFLLLLAVLVLLGSIMRLFDYLPRYQLRIVIWGALAYLTWRGWRAIQNAITADPSRAVIFFALLPFLVMCISIGLDYAIFGSTKGSHPGNLLAIAVWGMLTYLVGRIWHITRKKAGEGWKVITAGFSFVGLCLVLLLLIILCFYTEEKYTQTRNYYGYCTWGGSHMLPVEQDGVILSCTKSFTKRGRRFTTEERLEIAINDYLCHQNDYYAIGKAEEMKDASSDEVKKRFTLIPYGSKDEFLRENPDCCQLTWKGSEGYNFPVWDSGLGTGDGLVSGVGNGMFVFKHKVRYMDQQGTRKETESTHHISVSNCGTPRIGHY